jgi:hypothetical protein
LITLIREEKEQKKGNLHNSEDKLLYMYSLAPRIELDTFELEVLKNYLVNPGIILDEVL